ncbi:hypothetical protein NQ176_g1667 [Zarea fungicola]|uniref:Uncharacterized protein n=1 Tax=Zarea fungicola TaxID=93591 RepID=A0ACC1NSV2_9HYPO|nr:hypothetical protein NQ176_g1667 [Lecanicillium fungicola]
MDNDSLQLSRPRILQPATRPHRALSEPFILHEIFLRIPQQDLLLTQRVCRAWRELISTSRALQAELFFQPDAEKSSRRQTNGQVILNPLLSLRFPSFFELYSISPTGIGPWFDTHWAESIRPRFINTGNRCHLGFPPPKPAPYPKLDPQRSAAYRRHGASWRRMIPCRPAPTELQVSFHRHRGRVDSIANDATLYKMTFTNECSTACDGYAATETSEGLHSCMLTFALIYDIVEAAYFQGIPFLASTVQFDYTFQDACPPLPTFPPWEPGLPRRRPTPEEMLVLRRFTYRKRLREELPNEKIGGQGKVLLLLRGEMARTGMRQSSPYKDQFTVEDSFNMEDLNWTDKIEYSCP